MGCRAKHIICLRYSNLLEVFEFGAGAAAVIVMTCALYGWGRMTRNLVLLPDGTWPVSTALGMAAVIFLGGLLNFARMAFPIVLAALILVGLILALHAILRDEIALKKFWLDLRECTSRGHYPRSY
jgi:hypothetical protein